MRRNPERDLHRALVKQLQVRCKPDVLWWHTPNGGGRDVREASQLKLMGTLAGVPDLLFFRSGSVFSVELKAPGAKLELSASQKSFQDRFEKAGGYPWLTNNLDSALMFLAHSDLLR